MSFDAHKNFAYSTVATAPSPSTSGLSLIVKSGDGALFPTPPFNATVWPIGAIPVSTNAEVVRVTAIVGDTLTISRTQESSSARSILVGDQIAATHTAKNQTDVETALNNKIDKSGIAIGDKLAYLSVLPPSHQWIKTVSTSPSGTVISTALVSGNLPSYVDVICIGQSYSGVVGKFRIKATYDTTSNSLVQYDKEIVTVTAADSWNATVTIQGGGLFLNLTSPTSGGSNSINWNIFILDMQTEEAI